MIKWSPVGIDHLASHKKAQTSQKLHSDFDRCLGAVKCLLDADICFVFGDETAFCGAQALLDVLQWMDEFVG